MAAIGLVAHLRRESVGEHARELATWLVEQGHEVRVPPPDGAAVGLKDHVVTLSGFADRLDLVVSLGGDGSMLRAIELIGTTPTPILGVDHGTLGYLTEVRPCDARKAVDAVLRGDHAIEHRMLVQLTVIAQHTEPQQFVGLNEVVVERSSEVNTIRLRLDIDGHFFTTYAVDGMIVATPTGSTAYAFSSGGPIVDPTYSALSITPVSPHMLFDRSLVLAPTRSVRMTLEGHRPATVSIDGRRIATIGEGSVIECTRAPFAARFVTLGSRPFHHVLKEKFGLNDR